MNNKQEFFKLFQRMSNYGICFLIHCALCTFGISYVPAFKFGYKYIKCMCHIYIETSIEYFIGLSILW